MRTVVGLFLRWNHRRISRAVVVRARTAEADAPTHAAVHRVVHQLCFTPVGQCPVAVGEARIARGARADLIVADTCCLRDRGAHHTAAAAVVGVEARVDTARPQRTERQRRWACRRNAGARSADLATFARPAAAAAVTGVRRGAHALATTGRLSGGAVQPALIRDAGLSGIAHVAARAAVQDVVIADAGRTAGMRAAGATEPLTRALLAPPTERADEPAPAAVFRVHARIDAGTSTRTQRRRAALDTLRIEAGAIGAVGIAAATRSERARSAATTAVEIRLVAIALEIAAAGRSAPLADADRAFAVCSAHAGPILGARRAGAPAVDVGLFAVARAVAARGAHADAPGADRARAVGVREAGEGQLAG